MLWLVSQLQPLLFVYGAQNFHLLSELHTRLLCPPTLLSADSLELARDICCTGDPKLGLKTASLRI
jgi:hypothetical protein